MEGWSEKPGTEPERVNPKADVGSLRCLRGRRGGRGGHENRDKEKEGDDEEGVVGLRHASRRCDVPHECA